MSPQELLNEANVHLAAGSQHMTLVLPPKFHRPKGFPRGELLCVTQGKKVWSFSCERVIYWVEQNKMAPGLVNV